MTYRPDLPWSQIHDYLAEVGAETTQSGFFRNALEKIHHLIPHDSLAVFYQTAPTFQAIHGNLQKAVDDYNSYFIHVNPMRSLPNLAGYARVTDWTEFENTEFVTDYIRPFKIHWTLSRITPLSRLHLGLHRSRHSPVFNDREAEIMEILIVHLNNYHSCLETIAQLQKEHFYAAELAAHSKLLSNREAEVAALLCHRFTVPQIASKLLISRRSVETHVESIKVKLGVRTRQELIIKLLGEESGLKKSAIHEE